MILLRTVLIAMWIALCGPQLNQDTIKWKIQKYFHSNLSNGTQKSYLHLVIYSEPALYAYHFTWKYKNKIIPECCEFLKSHCHMLYTLCCETFKKIKEILFITATYNYLNDEAASVVVIQLSTKFGASRRLPRLYVAKFCCNLYK